MKTLTRDQLLQKRLRTEYVDVPGSPGERIRLRALSFPQLQESAAFDTDERADYVAFVLHHCLIDDKGEPVFDSIEAAKEALEVVDPALIDFIVGYGVTLSAPTPEVREQIKKKFESLIGEPSGESP